MQRQYTGAWQILPPSKASDDSVKNKRAANVDDVRLSRVRDTRPGARKGRGLVQLRDRAHPDVPARLASKPVAVGEGSDSYDVERAGWFEEAIGILKEIAGIFRHRLF